MVRKYRVSIVKVLEDGTEIEICRMFEPGWYVSPVLKALARQVHEPAPPLTLPDQMEITDAA